MTERPVLLVTGTSRGIGRHIAEYYCGRGYDVLGCSRGPTDLEHPRYRHFTLDVADEAAVSRAFGELRREYGRLDVLVNNAGIASMNHALLTPYRSAEATLQTNVLGTFLFCREGAKVMQARKVGRIINFSSVAVPLAVEGEAIYVASKAAIMSFTRVLARELAPWNITVNALGPTPIETDLIRSVPEAKIKQLVGRQAIHRLGRFSDVLNVIDFFIRPESDFVTGQVLFLGGV